MDDSSVDHQASTQNVSVKDPTPPVVASAPIVLSAVTLVALVGVMIGSFLSWYTEVFGGSMANGNRYPKFHEPGLKLDGWSTLALSIIASISIAVWMLMKKKEFAIITATMTIAIAVVSIGWVVRLQFGWFDIARESHSFDVGLLLCAGSSLIAVVASVLCALDLHHAIFAVRSVSPVTVNPQSSKDELFGGER